MKKPSSLILILLTLAATLLLGCNGSGNANRNSQIPLKGEVFTAIKIEDTTDYTKGDNRIFDKFEDLVAGLTQENFIGRGEYKDLPVTWWAGTADFHIQKWTITTNAKKLWITAYQRTSDRSRVVVNIYDEQVKPSDFYGLILQK